MEVEQYSQQWMDGVVGDDYVGHNSFIPWWIGELVADDGWRFVIRYIVY